MNNNYQLLWTIVYYLVAIIAVMVSNNFLMSQEYKILVFTFVLGAVLSSFSNNYRNGFIIVLVINMIFFLISNFIG